MPVGTPLSAEIQKLLYHLGGVTSQSEILIAISHWLIAIFQGHKMTDSNHWAIEDMPAQSGRIAIVTGTNSGIGYETARALVHRGGQVIMACRNVRSRAATTTAPAVLWKPLARPRRRNPTAAPMMPTVAARLWTVSEEMTGVQIPL